MLLNAAAEGNLDEIKRLSCECNIMDHLQDILISGARNGRLEVVEYVVSLGHDIRKQDDCALRIAAEFGRLEIIKYLESLGSDIKCNNSEALLWAAKNGHFETLEYLVEKGCDVRNRDDQTLIYAAVNGRLNIVEYLIDHGCDFKNQKNEALVRSILYGRLNVALFLIKHNYEINGIDDYLDIFMDSIKMFAISEGFIEIICKFSSLGYTLKIEYIDYLLKNYDRASKIGAQNSLINILTEHFEQDEIAKRILAFFKTKEPALFTVLEKLAMDNIDITGHIIDQIKSSSK
jgi:ankyrin repeat protein